MELNELYKFNSYQTPLTDELKESLPKEIWTDLIDSLNSVEFIKRLVASEKVRGFAKDRPRETTYYNDGRINVDITNPHILEDMDYFRERALFFEKHGKYTHLTPNPNPKSDYANFWKEEQRRWKYGVVREYDGEWIPGQLYFYWNYSPIWLVEIVKTESTAKKQKGERVYKFAKPWLGDYLFYHYMQYARDGGMHGKLLKTRGVGFSFKMGAISPCNMYVYQGSGNPNFHLASDKTFLSGDKGIWGKIVNTLDWIATHTPLPRMRLKDTAGSTLEIKLGFKDEYGIHKGLLSSVHGISLKDNPDKARGIRGPLIHYEEDGLFPNLEKAWNVNLKAVEDGSVGFGFMLAGGTGGTEGASFEGSEKLFYNPLAYEIHGIPNVFDKHALGDTLCGFFWGGYLNRNGCYDETTGEPDVIKALIQIFEGRYKIKYSSSDPAAITQKKAEEPITPQEAIMRTEGTVFPVADLKDYLETISVKRESFLAEHYVGDLVRASDNTIKFMPTGDKYPLRSYDKDTANRTGCVEIFEMPKANANGEIPRSRYICGIDPVDADAGTSLFSIMVMDTFTDRIVAEYTGRPRLAEEAYEIALRLIEFYNAEANYESNLKGLFSYFDKKNALHRLCDVPQVLRDMEFVKGVGLYGNKAKGTLANDRVNKWGRLLQADWMNSKAITQEDEEERLNLHGLRGLAYIEECIKWNSDGNFDRVSAGIMLFILREDRYKRTQSAMKNQDMKIVSNANDNFFKKNYKPNTNAISDKPVTDK
jgi:hypothetical protein